MTSRRQSETAVYALEFDPPWDAEGRRIWPRWVQRMQRRGTGPRYMEELVGDSGGVRHIISEEKAVMASTEAFFTDLRSQYLVGYSSSRPMDGKYRRIKVEAKDKDLQAPPSRGYLALAGNEGREARHKAEGTRQKGKPTASPTARAIRAALVPVFFCLCLLPFAFCRLPVPTFPPAPRSAACRSIRSCTSSGRRP